MPDLTYAIGIFKGKSKFGVTAQRPVTLTSIPTFVAAGLVSFDIFSSLADKGMIDHVQFVMLNLSRNVINESLRLRPRR